jgi:Putative peptidoglycan binding domain
MENITKGNKKLISFGVTLLILIGVFYYWTHRLPSFCFNFTPGMHFGDREGQVSPNTFKGIPYFVYEVGGLHKALQKEGSYIDPLELDGGHIYLGAFFGPSTQVAVREFQKNHGLEIDGFVNEKTLAKLNEIYHCPPVPVVTASSTATTTASSTVSNK